MNDYRIQRDIQARELRQKQAALVMLAKSDPTEAARSVNSVCEHCGQAIVPRVVTFQTHWGPRDQLVFPDRCDCSGTTREITKREIAELERAKREQHGERLAMLNRAGLTGWMADVNFDSFKPRDDWPRGIQCRQTVLDFASAMLAGALGQTTFLILCGEYGTGKSLLAAAAVRRALDSGWKNCYFRSWVEYTDRIKASWDEDSTERTQDILDELARGRLVVIDDIDKKNATDWTRERLYPVIDRRWRDALPTILTFNAQLADVDDNAPGRFALAEYLGNAVMDRVIQSCWSVVTFDGPSYRSGIQWSE